MEDCIQKNNIANFAGNQIVKRFLGGVFFLSFLLANLLMIIFFDYFLEINRLPLILNNWLYYRDPIYLYYIGGFLFSIVFIKTKWIISLFEIDRQTSQSELNNEKKKKWTFSFDSLKGFVLNTILLIRIVIFNIFNESFILIVFWIFYLFVLSIFHFITYPSDYDFSRFFTAVGMIGIIAGFFQFYTNNYQDKVTSKIESYLMNFTLKYVQNHINPNDFINFYANEGGDIHKLIEKFKKADEEISTDEFLESINYGRGFRGSIYFQIYNTYSNKDTLSKFNSFDQEASSFIDIDRATLDQMYKGYFVHKYHEFVTYIEKHNNFKELKSLLLPSIIFYDEMSINLYRLNSLVSNKKALSTTRYKKFSEYYNEFFINCYLELVGDLSNADPNSKSLC